MFYPILKPSPYDIEVIEGDDGGKLVIVALAQDNQSRIVSIVSELTPAEIDGGWFHEFSFSVDVVALDDSIEAFRTQDRNIAASYIPAMIRGLVMDVVRTSLRALVEDVGPPQVYWVTKDRNLPANALAKYHILREMLESIGYSVLQNGGTDPLGRRFWTMERK